MHLKQKTKSIPGFLILKRIILLQLDCDENSLSQFDIVRNLHGVLKLKIEIDICCLLLHLYYFLLLAKNRLFSSHAWTGVTMTWTILSCHHTISIFSKNYKMTCIWICCFPGYLSIQDKYMNKHKHMGMHILNRARE